MFTPSFNSCNGSKHNLNPIAMICLEISNVMHLMHERRWVSEVMPSAGLISHVPIAISRERIYRALAVGLMWVK